MTPLTASLLLLNALRFSPESVPAQGAQETLVTVERPGRVVLGARSASGTACELVDGLRGPIARSGTPGEANCALDVLLDPGTYKLRLTSRPDGEGPVTLEGAPYTELNARPVLLEPGREVRQPLASRQQASFWLHLDARQAVSVRVSGRTVGDVRLWRNGEWLETTGATAEETSPRPGQPLHEHWLETTLEAGDYLFTAYGTDPKRWTEGGEDDTLTVAYGFPQPPANRLFAVTLPPSGVASVALPNEPLAVFLGREGASRTASSVELFALSEDGLHRTNKYAEASCEIAASARVPQCSARVDSASRHVALLRGEPGARLTLQWAPLAVQRPETRPGEYTAGTLIPRFSVSEAGDYLVGLHEVPLDADSAPMGCVLMRERAAEWFPVAQDVPVIDRERAFRRPFNYDGRSATVFFEAKRAGRYLLATGGARKSRCELFRFNGGQMERLTTTEPNAQTCVLTWELDSGLHELRLYGGTEGIDQLTLAPEANAPTQDTPGHTSCLLPEVELEKNTSYQLLSNRPSSGSLRALLLRPLPLTLSEPLPVVLDGRTSWALEVARGTPVEALGPEGAGFTCARGGSPVEPRDGHCRPSGSGSEFTLAQAGDSSVSVWLHSPPPPAVEKPLRPYTPDLRPLTALKPSTPAWFDFEREQRRTFTFQVDEPGLYHATTLGLLSTTCGIRTAVLTDLADVGEAGRGRNCLVSSFLRPGRYLLQVSTSGLSRGRAGVSIERGTPKRAEDARADKEVFFRAEAGDLLQQQLTVTEPGRYTLSTRAQGANLRCRLDDARGWPLLGVPTACTQTLELAPGRYGWTQLPLTVESMRRTALERVRPWEMLQGEAVHPVRFDTWYRVHLGNDGKDTFSFEVPAPLTVAFSLSQGIQGRLYVIGKDGEARPVEVLPARTDRDATARPEPTEPGAAAAWDGKSVQLAPGSYQLVTEHYLGDVAINYSLYLRTDVLVPPATWSVSVPVWVPLRLPVDGTLRLRTSGDTDVRCRLLDGAGRLIAESAGRGADWNCAFAEPLAAGDYTLVLESETNVAGPTRVLAEMAPVVEARGLAMGGTLEVGGAVVRAALPVVPAEALQAVRLRAPEPFSCALEDARGAVVARQLDVRECAMLLRPGDVSWKVRVWTLGEPTRVMSTVATLPIRPRSDNHLPEGLAARAQVAHPGRYRTGRGIFCLPDAQRGLLRPCGPEVSLEAGAWVFGSLEDGGAALDLLERVDALEAPREERAVLQREVALLRQRSPEAALHLVRVEVPFGEPSTPACRLEGGVAQQREFACVAATGPVRESLARWWTGAAVSGEATVTRFAVPVPKAVVSVGPGLQEVTWTGGPSVRLALPEGPMRVKLSLPREAWAVRVDGQGAAVDLCAPSSTLSRCVLGGEGGAVFVWSPAEARAQVEVLAVDTAAREASLVSVFEAVSRMPGQQRLAIASAKEARRLAVTGAAARCVLTLEDGSRREGCDVQVPPGQEGELRVDVEAGAVRAVLAPPEGMVQAMLAPPRATSGTELPVAQALKLSGLSVERTLTLATDAAVHIQSDTGVCGLLQGQTTLAAEGLGRGCVLDRVLKAGRYRLLVRAFAGQPLSGTVTWTQEPVKELSEGIAPEESWVAPGQTRFFRFTTAAQGNVGLGLQVPAEVLSCTVLDAGHRVLGEGCQQFLTLAQGSYLLAIHAPADAERPVPFKPVLVGLAGTRSVVPEEYLRDLFQRIGATP